MSLEACFDGEAIHHSRAGETADHGQTLGKTFLQRYGVTLQDVVRQLMGGRASVAAATAQVEQARKDQTVQAAKQVANEPTMELRVNRVDVTKSTFVVVNRAASPWSARAAPPRRPTLTMRPAMASPRAAIRTVVVSRMPPGRTTWPAGSRPGRTIRRVGPDTCAGGGGIPTMYVAEKERWLTGIEAVIDKDLASELLARELDADLPEVGRDGGVGRGRGGEGANPAGR